MDFLASYGADSDEEESIHEEIPSTTSIPGARSKGNYSDQPKTKKLDVSILPLAIQNALLRGDNMDDSDSDNDTGNKVKNKEIDPSANKSAMTMLLGSLPKPKNSVPSCKLNQLSANTNEKGSSFVYSYDTTTGTANFKEKNQEPIISNNLDSELPASMSNRPISVFTLPVAKSNVDDVISSAYQLDVNSTFQFYDEYASSTTTMLMNNDTYDNTSDTNNVPNKRSKRDLEKSLLSGDTSIIEGNGNIIDVNGINVNWNKQSYVDQQSFKRQILNRYNICDGNGISKSQGRTHHINSLVAKAAQTEIKIMEKSLRK